MSVVVEDAVAGVVSTLDQALTELDAGRREDALVSLLNVWRKTNAPAIADVIDLLSAQLTEHEPPIRAVGSTSAKKAWSLAAEQGSYRPASLGRLLEVLPDSIDRLPRVRRLLEMDRDPRIPVFAVLWMNHPQVAGTRRAPFFGPVVALLAHTKDVRILPKLYLLVNNRSETVRHVGQKTLQPLNALIELLERTVPHDLSEAQSSTLASIRALISKGEAPKIGIGGGSTATLDPKEFFAKVYENPDDDDARAVLSDVLQQQGDPRGEFIALQLARQGIAIPIALPGGSTKHAPRSARERDLEDTWGRAWLGPLEPAILKGDVVFERGFLTRCRCGPMNDAIQGAQEWSTVTHVDVARMSRYGSVAAAFLVRPALRRSLRHVFGLGVEDVKKLNGTVPPSNLPLRWETLGVRVWDWAHANNAFMTAPDVTRSTYPSVTKLMLAHAYSYAITDASASQALTILDVFPKLVELDIAINERHLVALAVAAQKKVLSSASGDASAGASGTAFRKLTLRARGDDLAYAIDLAAKDLRVSCTNFRPEYTPMVAQVLRELARAEMIERVVLTSPGRVKVDEPNDALVRGASERMALKPIREAAKDTSVAFSVDV